ncbi:MAG: hypothetical protein HKN03_13780 [Acidimicrobiales bacterium]|nr:hypothetical protein [Acidimicrobiales bacterium]
MDVDLNDFAQVVAETAKRARGAERQPAHPLEIDREISHHLHDLQMNSHALSIASHPQETPRNKAGQLARRLALNPAEQRRLNRSLVQLVEAMDERARRQDDEISRLRAQVDRLLAYRLGNEVP